MLSLPLNMKIVFATVLGLTLLVAFVLAKNEPRFAPYVYATSDWSYVPKLGIKAVTLAFVLSRGGCEPLWDAAVPLNDSSVMSLTILKNIKMFTSSGGQIIVATGGAAVPYLESTCNSVADLAKAYKKILDVTGSKHLDLDMETAINTDVVTQAVAMVQKQVPGLTFSLTIAVDNHGITQQGVDILNSANKHGVVVDTVNIMAMDYLAKKAWALAVQDCVEATHAQLKKIWPSKSDKEIYSIIGITPMIGQNDSGEQFTLDDAQKTVQYAKSKGIGHLAFWSLNRDRSCSAFETFASDRCSGISQSAYAFTKIFQQFG